MKQKRDYMAAIKFKGVKTVLIRDCSSKADARRKLRECSHPDVEGIDSNIEEIHYPTAEIDVAEK